MAEDKGARKIAGKKLKDILYLVAKAQEDAADIQRGLSNLAVWVALYADRFDGSVAADIVGRCLDDGSYGLCEGYKNIKKSLPKLTRALRKHSMSPWIYPDEPSYSSYTIESKKNDQARRVKEKAKNNG